MIEQAKLKIQISSYWHQGTGKGSGSHLDALVEKDARGLPFISGRAIKGQLRDAVHRLVQWERIKVENVAPNTLIETLFGTAGFADTKQGSVPREDTQPGLLRISDAKLPLESHQYLAQSSQSRLRGQLFRAIYSTAIDLDSGVAKQHSLRGMEVAVPLTLDAEIKLYHLPEEGQQVISDRWQEFIKQALHLIHAVGAQRSRGLGRASLSLEVIK